MKIAIPVSGGKLCAHFGHCEEFALIDVDANKKQITKTEMVTAPEHEPGLLPRWLHELGATTVIAGGMGGRAQDIFAQNGIRVITGAPSDEPKAIVMAYLDNSLRPGKNMCDHGSDHVCSH
ncbi:MAG: NifB/NifX family molybdenum-iron cluster-binding protein [Candidatus Lindowbacteria bacterium]|nr:NifB/NifX family molybdenum-iron cluster-binding protein [Candidatus Lindowbacteria bacterium]